MSKHAFTLLLLLLMLPAALQAAPLNLLQNPALEDKDRDGVPDGWSYAPPGNKTTTSAEIAPGGAVKIVDHDEKVGVGLGQRVPAVAGHAYRLSADFKGGTIFLYLRFYNGAGQMIEPEARVNASAAPDWKRQSFEAAAPPGAAQVEAWFYTTSVGQTEVLVRQPELLDVGFVAPPTGPRIGPREFFEALNLDFPGLEAVKKAVAAGDFAGAEAAYLEYRRTKSPARWNVAPAAKPKTASATGDAKADLVLQHIYEQPYGSNAPPAQLPPDIDWNFNPVPPNDPSFTKEWTYITLNRMTQWGTLGAAYWKTLDEKYAREWIALLTDWVQDNPVPLQAGPGDTLTWRTIEAGIRMSGAWPDAYFRFLNSPSFTPTAHRLYATSVLEHMQRLRRIQIEFPDHGGNWVTMECNGLGTAAILFPEFKESPDFLKVAFDRMDRELTKQVYPDGAQVELASNYHEVARANFAALAKTAKLNNAPVPPDYLGKLRSMYEFDLKFMDQSGVLPPFNDSGPTNVVGSLKEADALWGGGEFHFGATLGKEGKAPPASNALPYAGYYVMRGGWQLNDLYLAFDAGPIGAGHWHEDMLNLYLRAFGKTLLTEPGVYQYDQSKWRAYILGTPAHNTIVVDGKEQHRGDHSAEVKMEPVGNPWLTSPLFDYAAGTYDKGYQATKFVPRAYFPMDYVGDKDFSVRHTRHVFFLKPFYVLVVDFLDGTGTHRYDAHFHLDAPDAKVDDATKAVQTLRTDGAQLGLFPLDTAGLAVKVVKGQEDPVLGWIPTQKRAIPTVVYTKQSATPASFATLLYPYQGEKPEVTSPVVKQGNAWQQEIATPFENVTVLIQRQPGAGPQPAPDLVTDARCAVVRLPRQTDALWLGLYQVTQFAIPALRFSTAAPATLNVARLGGRWFFFNAAAQPLAVNLSKPFQRTVQLPPQAWTEVTADKDLPAQPPALFGETAKN